VVKNSVNKKESEQFAIMYFNGLKNVKVVISNIKSAASNNKSLKKPKPFCFKKVLLKNLTKYLTMTMKHQNSKQANILNPGKFQVLLRYSINSSPNQGSAGEFIVPLSGETRALRLAFLKSR
jgi:hypothetical protein